jgi:hypothetical protein
MTRYYLPGTFNGSTAALAITESDLCNVTIAASGQAGASIKINTITPSIAGGWTGKYYKGVPITLTANPAPGPTFEWDITNADIVSGTTTSQTITVNLTNDARIVARYQPGTTGEVVKLDLAAALATATPGVVSEWGLFNALGGNIPIRANGNNDEVKYTIINEGGIKKLKVENYNLGAPGFIIEGVDEYNDVNGTGIVFEEGDIIEVSGRIESGESTYFVFNLASWNWDQLQSWGTGVGDFTHTFYPLDSTDVDKLIPGKHGTAYKGNIKVSTGGVDPYSGNSATPISTFVIEQIRISRMEY